MGISSVVTVPREDELARRPASVVGRVHGESGRYLTCVSAWVRFPHPLPSTVSEEVSDV